MTSVVSALLLSLLLATVPASKAVWPLDPEPDVVAPFAPPPDPYTPGHRGVDLSGSPGQVVRSALEGTVGFVGSIGGKPVVTVLHGGRRTTYEPVTALVERGQQVRAGQALGRLILPHSHCFPAACLHWGLLEGATYLDPLRMIRADSVRLLPLWREAPSLYRRGWTAPLWTRTPPWPRALDALP